MANNKQKILEATANIEVAKLLSSIEILNEKVKRLGEYGIDFEKTVKTLTASLHFVETLSNFRKSDKCFGKELALVDNIIKGIKSKSFYEEKIAELNARINRGGTAFKAVKNENTKLKNRFVGFIEKNLDGEKITKKELEEFLIKDNRSLQSIINDAMKQYFKDDEEARKKLCETNEYPF